MKIKVYTNQGIKSYASTEEAEAAQPNVQWKNIDEDIYEAHPKPGMTYVAIVRAKAAR